MVTNPADPNMSLNRSRNSSKTEAVITASISQMSSEIAGAVGRFHSETGINQLPDPFVPLQAIPNSLSRINAVLKQQQPSTGTERQKLREEIGRLNAKISRLERRTGSSQQVHRSQSLRLHYKKQTSNQPRRLETITPPYAQGFGLFPAIRLEFKKRLENILSLRETLFGEEDCPAPTEYPSGEPSRVKPDA